MAVFLSKPNSMPPNMVAPARDTPGNKASDWAKPICTACLGPILSMCTVLAVRAKRSIHNMAKPPTIKATATVMGENKYCLMVLCKAKPKMAAGRKAKNKFKTNCCAWLSLPKCKAVSISLRRYSQHTAKIAASWITISNTLPLSSLKCR